MRKTCRWHLVCLGVKDDLASYPHERRITVQILLCSYVSHMKDFGAKQDIDDGVQKVM